MAFQENLNASICMFSFFRSHGSNVSHGSGCRAGFFHGYAWCSLRLCSCGITTRMESLKMPPPTTTATTSVFFFGVNLDYLDFSGGIFDLFYEPVREKTNNLYDRTMRFFAFSCGLRRVTLRCPYDSTASYDLRSL